MFVLMECVWLDLPTLSCLCKSQATPRSSSSRLALGDQQSINLSSIPPLHLPLFLLHIHPLLLLLSTPLSSCLLPHLNLHHPPSPDLLSLQASRLTLHPLSPPPPMPLSLLLPSPREPRSSTAGRVLPLPSSRLHQPEPQVLRLSPTWSQPPREQVCTTVPSLKTLFNKKKKKTPPKTASGRHVLRGPLSKLVAPQIRALHLLIHVHSLRGWVFMRLIYSWVHVGTVLRRRHTGLLSPWIIRRLCSP